MAEVFVNYREKCLTFLIFAALVLTSSALVHGDTTLAPKTVSSILILGNWALFPLMLFFVNWQQQITKIGFSVLLLAIFWFIFYHFHVAFKNTNSGTLRFLYIVLVAFLEKNVLQNAVILFRKYLVVTSVLGIIVYLDFLTISVLPHTLVDYYSKDEVSFYVNYYFSYILQAGSSLRLCGLFNEPGYLGTFLAFALLIEKLNMKRIGNVAMLVAGSLTLSMAFFALLIIGWILMVVKNPKYIIASACVAVFASVIIPQIDNKGVQYLVSRFEYDSSKGQFKGDNRSGATIDRIYHDFQQSDRQLFGYGTGYCSAKASGFATFKTFVIEWGYLGFGLTFVFLMVLAFLACEGGGKYGLIYAICYAVSIYQRPCVFEFAYLVLLFGGIYKLNSD